VNHKVAEREHSLADQIKQEKPELPKILPLQRIAQEEGNDPNPISFSIVEVIGGTRMAKKRVAG